MNSATRSENEATRALKKVSHTIEQGMDNTVESLATGFKAVVADAEELLKATADLSSEGIVAAREKFKEKLEEAKGTLAEVQGIAKDKAGHAAAATEKYVADNPWKAVAIIGSIGVIVGMLVSRVSSKWIDDSQLFIIHIERKVEVDWS
jgi:ElaB/YqjD/DUF883 family membrane-anchored ribosome-binding protein